MAFKVQVGLPQIAIHRGRTVLVCEPDGSIVYPGDKGLYLNDTRLISSWSLSADGIPWDLLSGGPVDHDASRIHLTNRRLPTSSGVIEARTLGLFLSRSIAEGLHEDIDVVNHSGQPVAVNLEITLRCAFTDVFETKSGEAKRRGSIARHGRRTRGNSRPSTRMPTSAGRSGCGRGAASRWASPTGA